MCKNNFVTLQEMNINKGRFLYFDISSARNVSPHNYIPNDNIKHSIYNDSSVYIKESDKDKIKQILDIDIPEYETDPLSEPMQKHTQMIIKKYAERGLINLKQTRQLAEDIRQNLIVELANNDTIAKQIIGWASLKISDKKQLIKNLNYIIGSQRIDHTGKSIVIIAPDEVTTNGQFRASIEKEFMFNNRLLSGTFDRCFGTIVHENIHRFQNQGLSAIPINVVNYMHQIYTKEPYKHYFNNLAECESRYIQAFVMRDFSRDFMQYYNNRQGNNILSPTPRDNLWDR